MCVPIDQFRLKKKEFKNLKIRIQNLTAEPPKSSEIWLWMCTVEDLNVCWIRTVSRAAKKVKQKGKNKNNILQEFGTEAAAPKFLSQNEVQSYLLLL